jgi:hypothetical protein
MRCSSFLLPAALFVAGATATAQTLPYPPPDTESISTVEVTAPARVVRLQDEEARQIAGTYAMSNGWRLKVRPATRHIDATIDQQKPIRLVALSADRFVSRDGKITMEFNRGDRQDEMLMRYSPGPNLADIVIGSSSVAQR